MYRFFRLYAAVTGIALIGLGKRNAITLPALRTFAGRAARLAQSLGSRRMTLLPPLGFRSGCIEIPDRQAW